MLIKDSSNLTILALAGIIKKFYQQTDEPLNIYKFEKLNLNNDIAINIIKNPNDKLKNYNIETSNTSIIVTSSLLLYTSNFRKILFTKFKFLNNTILETSYFDMYRQNLDLKFLSYIATMPKLEYQSSF